MLNRTPFWLDEVLQLGVTRDHRSLSQLLDWVLVQPGASPLPYLAQKTLMDTLGFSTFAARLPAALCSVAAGVVFGLIAARLKLPRLPLALAMFLLIPLQFRYGLEARVYSQGLLLSLISLWLFLRLRDAPSPARAVLYAASLIVGLYSQPLTLFPALAHAILSLSTPLRRFVLAAIAAAALAYVPWYLAQHQAQANLVPPFGFSFRQAAPLTLLHDLAGDGFACSIPLAILAAWAAFRSATVEKRLLLWTVLLSIAGPIAMDRAADYFFAERQLLFALPAIVMLAAQAPSTASDRILAYGLASIFFVAAVWNDYYQSTSPRDRLAATAEAIAISLQPGTCFLTTPGDAEFYMFFQPELKDRLCAQPPSAPELFAVTGEYAKPGEHQALVDSLSGAYQQQLSVRIGRAELATWRRR